MRLCVLCIGNRDAGDDSIGPFIADGLFSSPRCKVIDAGVVPENFTGVIKSFAPDTLLLVDAVDMGSKPGEIRLVPKEALGAMHISTHGMPLSVMISYLEQYISTILFIGIQPACMHGELTKDVKKAGMKIIDCINKQCFSEFESI